MGYVKVRYFVTKSMKDGKILYYWQPRPEYEKIGFLTRRLDDDLTKAVKQAVNYNLELDAWRAGKQLPQGPQQDTVSWLIAEYKKSADFRVLTPKVTKEYTRQLNRFEKGIGDDKGFGDIHVNGITPQVALQFLYKLSDRKREALYAMEVLRKLFGFGRKVTGSIATNPFEKLGLKRPEKRRVLWEQHQIVDFIDIAFEMDKPEFAAAMAIYANVGPNPVDVRKMPKSAYDGEAFTYRRSKTDAPVYAPMVPYYKTVLDRAMKLMEGRKSVLIISRKSGRPYSEFDFSRDFREVATEANVPKEKQAKDLRRNCVVTLAEAGCTVPEIASITGHQIDYCQKILNTYWQATKVISINAMQKVRARMEAANA